MRYIIGIIGSLAAFTTVFLIIKLILAIVKKQPKTKHLKLLGISLVAFFVVNMMMTFFIETDQSNFYEFVETENSIGGYTIKHGELLSVYNPDGKSIVIKTKIAPSYSNSATINQNYYNIEDLILNQGLGDYDMIDYWAIADMSDGSESKVVSFELNKNAIQKIANGHPANLIGEIADNLWIHPSLN